MPVEIETEPDAATEEVSATAEQSVVDTDEVRQEKEQAPKRRRKNFRWLLAFAVLPLMAVLLTAAAAFFKWEDSSARASDVARIESVAAAKEITVGLLSYNAETVEKDLGAVTGRLTGSFKDDYQQLIDKVVVPGAKEQHISAVATVPAMGSVSATPDHAVVLLFVNQTTTIGTTPPSDMQSSVRVTLDKVDGQWRVSGFDPV